jgi:hypothetical protein
MKFIYTLLILSGTTFWYEAQAQCCAMGNPFNNASATGVMESGRLQVGLTYKYGLFDTYFRNRVRLINYGMYREMSYQFMALNFSYGISDRLSLEHEAGYFLSKSTRFADPELDKLANKGRGLSNGMLMARYAFLVIPSEQLTFDAGAGIKYPFARTSQSVNGVELPVEAQPSTGALGGVFQVQASKRFRLFNLALQHRYDFNTENYNNYTFGDAHITTFSAMGEINRIISGMVLLRNEYRGPDKAPNNARLASEGSHIVILAPQLGITPIRNLQLSVFGDIPVYRYYYGEQISNRYAIGMNLVWSASLKRTIPGTTGFDVIEGN